jgi:ATP adenylyltransferase
MDHHEQLWAPWRLAYVSGEAAAAEKQAVQGKLAYLPGADPNCFICRAVAATDDRANLLVERAPQAVVILNRFPYNNGHLLVAPALHKGRPDELDDAGRRNAGPATAGDALCRPVREADQGRRLQRRTEPRPRSRRRPARAPALARRSVIPQSLDAMWELLTEANSAPS